MDARQEDLLRKMKEDLALASRNTLYYWIQGGSELSADYEKIALKLEKYISRIENTANTGA